MGRSKTNRTNQLNKRVFLSKLFSPLARTIAAKNRRGSAKCRVSQGMCFSVPTPHDPEPCRKRKRISEENKNTMNKKVGRSSKGSFNCNDACSRVQEQQVIKAENLEKGKLTLVRSIMGPEIAINVGKSTCQIIKWDASNKSWKEHGSGSNTGCPSNFLVMCLKTIQAALQRNEAYTSEGDRPLFANAWGIDFWNCYTNGKDVLETSGADSTTEKIAWMTSTAVDTISMKEKEGLSLDGPFLLYLVPSQDRANKVRQVCKPLKEIGIHTMSLHSGASVDHHIHGLMSCEPEFLVSTPERLLKLLSLKAVDISEVSLMVIDGLEAPFKGAYFDAVKSIRQFISGNPITVVFCDCTNTSSISVCAEVSGKISPQ